MKAVSWVWSRRSLWLPAVVLALVLAATFLLVPASEAPFVYAFF